MGRPGIIISEETPGILDNPGYTWLKLFPDGKREWYEGSDSGWTLVHTEEAPNTFEHATHGDINFTGSVSSGGEAGIDTPGEGEYEVGQIESIKVRNGLIVALTEK